MKLLLTLTILAAISYLTFVGCSNEKPAPTVTEENALLRFAPDAVPFFDGGVSANTPNGILQSGTYTVTLGPFNPEAVTMMFAAFCAAGEGVIHLEDIIISGASTGLSLTITHPDGWESTGEQLAIPVQEAAQVQAIVRIEPYDRDQAGIKGFRVSALTRR